MPPPTASSMNAAIARGGFLLLNYIRAGDRFGAYSGRGGLGQPHDLWSAAGFSFRPYFSMR